MVNAYEHLESNTCVLLHKSFSTEVQIGGKKALRLNDGKGFIRNQGLCPCIHCCLGQCLIHSWSP